MTLKHGFEAILDGLRKHQETKEDIVNGLRKNNGVYIGTLIDFARSLGYATGVNNSTIKPHFAKVLYAVISDGYVDADKPKNPETKYDIKLELTVKAKQVPSRK